MLKISFLGAAETVTGSCYLLENEQYRVLIDCGLFQGVDVYHRNFEDFDFDPKSIDFVILTHAHMDHSGLLPKLMRKGFSGQIFLTPPTAQLSEILLLDAAKIQESNVYSMNTEGGGHGQSDIIYTTFDSLNAIGAFTSIDFDNEVEIGAGLKIRFFRAGHILGAGSVCIDISGTRLVFSGDLGRRNESLIQSFYPLPSYLGEVDYIVMESLYGGVVHQTRDDAINELLNIISETIERNGNVVIPSFAVHKTQELLEVFKTAFANNKLNSDIKIILDSPLAIRATSIYENNTTYYDQVKYKMTGISDLRSLLRFPNLKIMRTHKQSLKSAIKDNSVFVAGSGMAEGGRVIRHLINNLPGQNNSIVFVGYQAEGTKGRELLASPQNILLDGKMISVKAKIKKITGFSSHGDNSDLLLWLQSFNSKNLKKVFLTHADIERSEVFSKEISTKGFNPYIPKWKEAFELN